MHIRDILTNKGFDVIVIDPSATVTDLVAILREHNLGAVVVSGNGRSVDGIVTERDVVRRLADGPDFLSEPVSSIMTAVVHTCTLDDSVQSLMQTMTNARIRHIPVVDDDNQLGGIVSIGDVVKSHISEVEFERDQLEGYVHG
ncbi:CBS domain-containing protein [Microlunatus ginsengisoli]|uniref:CBS domain-containing protein n=1 Tax=Microlunatus ginsengisoli TaxID=363863 RepID=A0ABP7AM26_9ACTN